MFIDETYEMVEKALGKSLLEYLETKPNSDERKAALKEVTELAKTRNEMDQQRSREITEDCNYNREEKKLKIQTILDVCKVAVVPLIGTAFYYVIHKENLKFEEDHIFSSFTTKDLKLPKRNTIMNDM